MAMVTHCGLLDEGCGVQTKRADLERGSVNCHRSGCLVDVLLPVACIEIHSPSPVGWSPLFPPPLALALAHFLPTLAYGVARACVFPTWLPVCYVLPATPDETCGGSYAIEVGKTRDVRFVDIVQKSSTARNARGEKMAQLVSRVRCSSTGFGGVCRCPMTLVAM